MRPALAAVLVVLVGALGLAGCAGSDDPGLADDSGTSEVTASPTPATTPSPAPSRGDTGQTCAGLYHPPDQLVPRAIELVHGNTTGDPVAEAADLVTGLSNVAATADPMLAADIAVVRISVDTQRAAVQSGVESSQDLTSFDAAVRRLGKACASYGE
ncbi:hypothetical protein GCM10009795_040290 [Nocardioides hankookensis]|uniref:DUF732 domain-containing protein n=1 Tax=Nocardioides hankookensis TaxID=443157 RepID=A0ABW1LPP0_9ACTN